MNVRAGRKHEEGEAQDSVKVRVRSCDRNSSRGGAAGGAWGPGPDPTPALTKFSPHTIKILVALPISKCIHRKGKTASYQFRQTLQPSQRTQDRLRPALTALTTERSQGKSLR